MDTSKPKWIMQSAHASGWRTVDEDPGVFVRLAHPLDTRSVVILFDPNAPQYDEHMQDLHQHLEQLRDLGRAATRFLEIAGWRKASKPPRMPFDLAGTPPFGMRVEAGRLVEDEREQAALKRILELRSEGLSLRAMAKILVEEGCMPRRATRWHAHTLSEIIKRA